MQAWRGAASAEFVTLFAAISNGILLQYYLDPDPVSPDLLPRSLRTILGLPQTP